jgi:hypothetical protein
MDIYWVYNIPTWQLFALIISIFVALTMVGMLTFRKWTDNWFETDDQTNDMVGHFLGFTGLFYGILLGMVAVGAWESYGEADEAARNEASHLASLYADVARLPEASAYPLKSELKYYTMIVIDQEWPQQRRGIAPIDGDAILAKFGRALYATPVSNTNEEIALEEAVSAYNDVIQARRHRVQSVISTSLPGSLWWVLGITTLAVISLSMLFRIDSAKLDFTLNLLLSILTGSIIAFIIAMDNPYRGEISVSPEPYQLIFDRLMMGLSANI